MMTLVEYRLEPPAAVLTLNRPDRLNALSGGLVAALTAAFDQAATDASRCVILTANGPFFSAGLDLLELGQKASDDEVHATALALATLFERIRTFPKPTIAMVQGSAFAGGAGLVSVCDLALAAPSAKFGYPGVRRGLAAAVVIPPLLRLVGERTARALLLTGEAIDAETAARVGLINAVAPMGELLERALDWARSLAEGGPSALAATKGMLSRIAPTEPTIHELAAMDTEAWTSTDAREGLAAFAQKRSPTWSPSPKG